MRLGLIVGLLGVWGGGPAAADDFDQATAAPASSALAASLQSSRAAMATAAAAAFHARRDVPKYGFAFDADVPADIQEQLRLDLAMLQGVQGGGNSNLQRELFGPMAGIAYIKFFESHIRSIGMGDCGGPAAVACAGSEEGQRMWLTSNYVKLGLPQLARLAVMVHEAKHTESAGGGWRHVRCPTPFKDENGDEVVGLFSRKPLAGISACDTTSVGAYATGLVMLKNIQKFCTNCSGKMRMDAGIYADDVLKRIVDRDAKTAIVDDLYR